MRVVVGAGMNSGSSFSSSLYFCVYMLEIFFIVKCKKPQ